MVWNNYCPRQRSSKMDSMIEKSELKQALTALIINPQHDKSARNICNNQNKRQGKNFYQEQAAFLRDKTSKNSLKQFNMTTDLTQTEADDRFTSDTNFVRPALIHNRSMAISKTRKRYQPGKSKVPNIYDDSENMINKNQKSLKNATNHPLMSHYQSSWNQNFDKSQ